MSDPGPIDLADFQLKPLWVDDLDKPNPFAEFEGRDVRDDRGPRRDGGGGNRGPGARRDGGGGGAGGNRGPGARRSSGGGGAPGGPPRGDRPPRPQGDRRPAAGGGNRPPGDRRPPGGADRGPRRDGRSGPGQGQRQERRPDRPDRPPLYELVDIELSPDPAGLEAVAKQIKMTGRSYPIFDLARLSLGGPERYHATFTVKPEVTQIELVECRADHSLWLSMNEAVRHFSNGPLFSRYYKKEVIEVEPPKGNFTVIAVCGLSGELLGPPNFHAYQKNLMDLHQRKFSRMHIDGYKRKIQMVRDEETIEKWKNSLTKSTQYTYTFGQVEEAPAEVEVPKSEETPIAPAEEEGTVVEVSEAIPAEEASVEETVTEPTPETAEEASPEATEETSPEATAKPVPAGDAIVFKTKAEAEKHFMDTHGKKIFVKVKSAKVPGTIPAALISGALHGMLKRTAERQARFPMPMVKNLSPMLEKHGLRFFKIGKKETYVARSRPRALSAKTEVSPRIRSIVQYIRDNEKQDLHKLVTALVPNASAVVGSEPTADEIAFLKDLRWLIREGFVIEFSNGELRLGSLNSPLPPVARAKSNASKPKKQTGSATDTALPHPMADQLHLRMTALKKKRRSARLALRRAEDARRGKRRPAAAGARLGRKKRV